MRRPLVSVCIPTCNHERFLTQAIQSAIDQVGDFDMEIVVAVDRSVDGTLERAKQLQRAHPDRIRVIHSDTQRGMDGNWRAGLAECCGEYIALMDGDDYWLSNGKLQLLVSHLESQSCDHGAAHAAALLKNGQIDGSIHCDHHSGYWQLKSWPGFGPATSSIVVRRWVLRELLSPRFDGIDISESMLVFLAHEDGGVRYFPDLLSVYRIHDRGLYSGADNLFRYRWTMGVTRSLLHAIRLKPHEAQWLRQVWDFNAVQIARNVSSVLAWTQEIEEVSGPDWRRYSASPWVVEDSCAAIGQLNESLAATRASSSFRVGNAIVRALQYITPAAAKKRWRGVRG